MESVGVQWYLCSVLLQKQNTHTKMLRMPHTYPLLNQISTTLTRLHSNEMTSHTEPFPQYMTLKSLIVS